MGGQDAGVSDDGPAALGVRVAVEPHAAPDPGRLRGRRTRRAGNPAPAPPRPLGEDPMTTLSTLRGPSLRRLGRHYLEMIVAMILGMVVLSPVESLLFGPIGWQYVEADPELRSLVMATNMTVAMTAWMVYRRHRRAPIAEMA